MTDHRLVHRLIHDTLRARQAMDRDDINLAVLGVFGAVPERVVTEAIEVLRSSGFATWDVYSRQWRYVPPHRPWYRRLWAWMRRMVAEE